VRVEGTEPVTASAYNVVIYRTNNIEPRAGVLTAESMRAAVERLRNEPAQMAIQSTVNDAMLYGTGIRYTAWIDESVRGIDNPAFYAPSVTELLEQGVTLPISEEEHIQSVDRETFYRNGGDH
jgi:hypothetical protein